MVYPLVQTIRSLLALDAAYRALGSLTKKDTFALGRGCLSGNPGGIQTPDTWFRRRGVHRPCYATVSIIAHGIGLFAAGLNQGAYRLSHISFMEHRGVLTSHNRIEARHGDHSSSAVAHQHWLECPTTRKNVALARVAVRIGRHSHLARIEETL